MTIKQIFKTLSLTAVAAVMSISLSGCIADGPDASTGASSLPVASTSAKATAAPAAATTTASATTAPTATEPAVAKAAPIAAAPVAATKAVVATGNDAYAKASPFPGGCLLWKPHSEIDGGLVVLVPANMGGATPVIRRANGEVFATGREHVQARGHNLCDGIRYHYVFGKGTGGAFPRPSILSIGGANYQIPNPAGRY